MGLQLSLLLNGPHLKEQQGRNSEGAEALLPGGHTQGVALLNTSHALFFTVGVSCWQQLGSFLANQRDMAI